MRSAHVRGSTSLKVLNRDVASPQTTKAAKTPMLRIRRAAKGSLLVSPSLAKMGPRPQRIAVRRAQENQVKPFHPFRRDPPNEFQGLPCGGSQDLPGSQANRNPRAPPQPAPTRRTAPCIILRLQVSRDGRSRRTGLRNTSPRCQRNTATRMLASVAPPVDRVFCTA